MAKKNARRRSTTRPPEAGNSLPAGQLSTFDMVFRERDYSRALRLAEAMLQRYPGVAQAHELYANVLGRLERFSDASEAMERLVELVATPNAAQRLKLAQYQVLAGKAAVAVAALEEIVAASPDHLVALVWLSRAYHQLGNNHKALGVNDRALALDTHHEEALLWRARILDQLKRHDDALKTLERLLAINPKHIGVNNHIATLYVKEGDYKAAETHFSKELELDPTNGQVHSNLLMTAHYNPEYSAKDILAKALEWDKRFAEPSSSGRAGTLQDPAKKLRIGLLSGGFRMHPVGQMILPALQHLSSEQFEITAYSTNQLADKLTHKIQQAVHHWQVIEGLSDRQLDQKIRDDGIDILIDMNGAGEGSRYTVLSREPAPLIVKWVGSLINTTGLSCFDYFLSDTIETPEGVDNYYTEKLIRLPDDYICYNIPEDAPPTGSLPALSNGYITFGCLNNPAKLSPPMLAEWAVLLHEIPDSKLLLKGVQFDSERYQNKVLGTLAEHGISRDRLILEGPAQHRDFMATYQRIDIALDTWPYSGGLTTCEALLMGVPVVTRVGPTFAGRHSATHLVNAGLPELVTDSWDDFRKRAKELANDLPNLAVIRAALRTILMDSPICDGPRFANHLMTALRAIWQRHCEGKAPEALTFSKSGVAQFADEESPVKLALALPSEGFDWQLESPVVAIDNGAVLAARADARDLLGSGRIVMLSFDPAGKLPTVDHLSQYGEIQHFPYTALGDGRPANLYVDDGAESSTLAPLTDEGILERHRIPTVALDSIEGLPNIDLLALDASHDVITILNHAEKALKSTLLVQARVVFQPSLHDQPDFARVHTWMEQHGFRFYCFNDEQYRSHLPDSVPEEKRQATELVSADLVFLPSHKRMALLSNMQRVKLAFILHTVLGAKDMAYSILRDICRDKSDFYLKESGLKGFVSNEGLEVGRGFENVEMISDYLREASLSVVVPNHSLPGELVVSLTSYKTRFDNLCLTLRSLLLQELCPDHLILWIAEEEKNDLPQEVWGLERYGLSIRFCEDILSYKKIIPSLREHPDSFIVTADDDLYYDPGWLKGLVDSWDGDKGTVVAHRAHKIRLDDKGRPLPYRKWKWQVGQGEPADGLIFPTSGAGVLWPPHVFHGDVISSRRFMELCPSADDIWLYWMASLNGAKIKRSNYEFRLVEWPSENSHPLWEENIIGGGNDRQIERMVGAYGNEFFSPGFFDSEDEACILYSGEQVRFFLPNKNDHIQKIIKNSSSFYELKMLEDIRSRLPSDGVILDVGANIGNHSIYFGKFCGASKVFSFEPHPSIFKVLETNVCKNSLSDKVVCLNLGVGEEEAEAKISFYDESNIGMSRLEISDGGNVDVVSLDKFCEDFDVEADLIKIDVEGMEPDVIKGGAGLIDRCSPVLYVEAGDASSFKEVSLLLGRHGYEVVERFNATATYLFLKKGVHF